MAKPSTRFPEVLTVDIHGVGKKTFRTATQVQKWAANELETWQNVKPAMDSNTPFGGRFRFDDMTEHAKGLANHALSYINNPDPFKAFRYDHPHEIDLTISFSYLG